MENVYNQYVGDQINLGDQTPTTQKELAYMFGITDKKLTEIIPEFVDLIYTRIVILNNINHNRNNRRENVNTYLETSQK